MSRLLVVSVSDSGIALADLEVAANLSTAEWKGEKVVLFAVLDGFTVRLLGPNRSISTLRKASPINRKTEVQVSLDA
jgi:hypothetical protein